MSRSRKPHGNSPRAAAQDASAATPDPRAPLLKPQPSRRPLLVLAIAATFFWSVGLAALALLTANPPAISREQILRADAVVVARPERAAQRNGSRLDRLHVERVLSGGLSKDDVITVLNLPKNSPLATGVSCVVPLTHFRRDYEVTMLAGQPDPPLIYRATPETMEIVNQYLREAND